MKVGCERFLEYIEEQTYIELTCSSCNSITTKELIEWCNELGINKVDLASKLMIKDKLIDEGFTCLEFYNRFKHKAYGIHPSRFSNKFKVNSYQRKKMIETNFLDIAYYKKEEIFPNRFEKVPFINAEKYFQLTKEDIEIWRADNIKGYNMKQLKMDI